MRPFVQVGLDFTKIKIKTEFESAYEQPAYLEDSEGHSFRNIY